MSVLQGAGNIDQIVQGLIFGGGGAAINWTKLTHKRTQALTTPHLGLTWFDITGAGFLESFILHGADTYFGLQVDGGAIESYTFGGFTSPWITNNSVIMRRPFSTSLKLTCNNSVSSIYNAIVWLRSGSMEQGFNHKQWSPVFAFNGTIAHQANTHVDIVGNGYLVNLNGGGDWAVQIDGGPIKHYSHPDFRMNSYMGYIRFNTSLKITCSNAPAATVFAQYFTDP